MNRLCARAYSWAHGRIKYMKREKAKKIIMKNAKRR